MKFTKETGKRMLRTFIQTIIGYIAVNLAIVDFTASREVIKSALIGLLISAVSAGLSAVMNLQSTATENGGNGSLTFEQFLNTYKVGSSYDYNNTGYKGQCVSLVKLYIRDVLGVTPQAIGDAKDYWNKRNGSYIQKLFTPIKNTASFVPQKGDVFVRTSGTYGHIGIVISATKDYFYTIEQNYGGSLKVQNIKHTDWNNINFLRPKDQSNIKTEMFEMGKTYTLTTNVNVRTGAGTNYRQKKVGELTKAGQIRCTSQNTKDDAVLKKGIEIIPKAVKTIGSDVWVQLINGWVCIYYKGDKYVK